MSSDSVQKVALGIKEIIPNLHRRRGFFHFEILFKLSFCQHLPIPALFILIIRFSRSVLYCWFLLCDIFTNTSCKMGGQDSCWTFNLGFWGFASDHLSLTRNGDQSTFWSPKRECGGCTVPKKFQIVIGQPSTRRQHLLTQSSYYCSVLPRFPVWWGVEISF